MTGNPRCPPQFMSSTSLPLLMVVVGVTTAALAPLAGLRAKASVAARNGVLLWGIAALVGANLCFALVPSVQGGRCPRAGGRGGRHACRPDGTHAALIAKACGTRQSQAAALAHGSLSSTLPPGPLCCAMLPWQACCWARRCWACTWRPRTA